MGKYTGKWQEAMYEELHNESYTGRGVQDTIIEMHGCPYRPSVGFLSAYDDDVANEIKSNAVNSFIQEYSDYLDFCPKCGQKAMVVEGGVKLCLKCDYALPANSGDED